MIKLLEKDYSWESLYDAERDVSEAISEDEIPKELKKVYKEFWSGKGTGGVIKIKIEWHPD